MIVLYYVLLKILTAIGLVLLSTDRQHVYTSVTMIAQSIFVLVVCTLLKSRRPKPAIKINLLRINFMPAGLAGGVLIVTLVLLYLFAQIGFPTFAANANQAKTQLQQHAYLVRWYRFFVPALISVFVCHIAGRAGRYGYITITEVGVIAFFSLIGMLMGFKGFILTYVLVPLAVALQRFFRVPLGAIAAGGIALVFLLIGVTSFIEKIDYQQASIYFADRLTAVQAVGPHACLENLEELRGYPVLQHDASTTLYRFTKVGNPQSFNAKVFEIVMGENPFGMEVTVPTLIAGLIQFGRTGFILSAALEVLLACGLFYHLSRIPAHQPRYFALTSLGCMYFIDAVVNGVAVIRFVDFLVSTLLFLPFILLLSYGTTTVKTRAGELNGPSRSQ